MKILFLNTWGATMRGPLSEFIKHHAVDTDIFCFQEANSSMQSVCQELLYHYHPISASKLVAKSEDFYQSIYIRNTLDVASSGTIFSDDAETGLGVYVEIDVAGQSLYVCNFHGVSRPTDKRDTPSRIRQAQELIDLFDSKPGAKIIGGDFNVFPTNQSIQLFQKNGYQDLIHDYKITNTRNRLVWERYPENEKQYYADFVFASPEVRVNTFNVPDIEVSDHLPLILDVTLQGSPASTTPSVQYEVIA